MKTVVLQENLARGLNFVSRSVAARPQLPVLANVLLKTDGGRLRLSATNLETGVHCWSGARVEKEGEVTVPAKIFTEFINSLPQDKVSLSFEDNMLTAECLNSRADFNTVPAKEFPAIPLFPEKPLFLLPSSLFKKAITRVSFAAATDEGRPVLTGVLVEIGTKEISFVATDGFRLSLFKTQKPKGLIVEKEVKILIPARALSEVLKVMDDFGGEKEISFAMSKEANQAMFLVEDCLVASQLIGGEYPAYQKIIPQGQSGKIQTDKEDFLRAIKMAAIFARDSANIVRLKIDKGEIIVSANAPQVGNNITAVGCKGDAEGEIAFNAKYLLDFLNIASGEQVFLETNGSLAPGIFKSSLDPDFLHVIMPVRVQT